MIILTIYPQNCMKLKKKIGQRRGVLGSANENVELWKITRCMTLMPRDLFMKVTKENIRASGL